MKRVFFRPAAAALEGDRRIEAHAMPQGDLSFKIDGPAVRLIVGSQPGQPASFVGMTLADAVRARDALNDALRAFEVGAELSGRPTAALHEDGLTAPVPRLLHSEAEAVGVGLFDYLDRLGLSVVDLTKGQSLDDGATVTRGELLFADAVQRVLVLSAEKEADRENPSWSTNPLLETSRG